jgi:hypothetical protein
MSTVPPTAHAPSSTLPRAISFRIARSANVDEETVRRRMDGRPTRPGGGRRIDAEDPRLAHLIREEEAGSGERREEGPGDRHRESQGQSRSAG